MIRTKLLAAAALSAALAAPALANAQEAVTGTVFVNATVADRCLFLSPTAFINLGEIAVGGSGSGAGFLNTAAVDGESANLEGWCNGTAATMSVEAFALENTSFLGSPPTGFDRVVNYTATANNGSASANDSTLSAGGGAAVPVGIFAAQINVALSASSTPGSGRLIAGDYNGSVVVTLTPNTSLPQTEE